MAKKSVEEVLQMGENEVNSENGINIEKEMREEQKKLKEESKKETRGRKLLPTNNEEFLENAMDILKKGTAPKKDRMALCDHLSRKLFNKEITDGEKEVLLAALKIGKARNELEGELLYSYAELEMYQADSYYLAKEDHPSRMLGIIKGTTYKGRYIPEVDRFEVFVKIVTPPMAQLDYSTAAQLAAGVQVDPISLPKEKIRYRLVSFKKWEFEAFFEITSEENYKDENQGLGVFEK